MKRTWCVMLGAVALGTIAGCAGQPRQIQMRDGSGASRQVDFPQGTVFGDISQEQVGTLAQMVADNNLATAARLDAFQETAGKGVDATRRIDEAVKQMETSLRELKASAERNQAALQRVEDSGKKIEAAVEKSAASNLRTEETLKRIEETAQASLAVEKAGLATGQKVLELSQEAQEFDQRSYDSTRMMIEAFEKMARRQGTGELTVFYPTGSSTIGASSLQQQRIVQFVDYLSRESRGRKIMIVSVGSASATGPKELNERLAKERSEAPLAIVGQYLVNVPHEFVKIYGTGDAYSPKGLKKQEHLRFQSARLIAYYEKGQEPTLPEPSRP